MSAVATSGGIRRRIVDEAAIPPEVCHRHRTSSRQDQVADPSPSANVTETAKVHDPDAGASKAIRPAPLPTGIVPTGLVTPAGARRAVQPDTA